MIQQAEYGTGRQSSLVSESGENNRSIVESSCSSLLASLPIVSALLLNAGPEDKGLLISMQLTGFMSMSLQFWGDEPFQEVLRPLLPY